MENNNNKISKDFFAKRFNFNFTQRSTFVELLYPIINICDIRLR